MITIGGIIIDIEKKRNRKLMEKGRGETLLKRWLEEGAEVEK